MDWKDEVQLIAAADLTWGGKAAYAAARWSVTRWAKSSRSRPAKYTVHWRSGESMVLRGGTSDVLVFREIFLENCYRAAIEALSPKAAGLRILDCGANIGLFSALCAKFFNSPSVVSVEPDPGNIEALRTNIANLRAEVMTIPAFVGGSNGLGYLHDAGQGEWGFQLTRTAVAGVTPVSIFDIPTLMKHAGWEKIDLLKVDIEGAEVEVFAKNESWIDSVSSIIVELHAGYSIDQFINDISQSGRKWRMNHRSTYGDQHVCSVTRE